MWGQIKLLVAPLGGATAVFLTLNGQNSVAIALINANLCMNIVVGSTLSLVMQRKNYNASIGGNIAMLYTLHCHIRDLGGTAGVSPSYC